MKNAMAVKILVAGICALGTAAAAQTDANPAPNQQPGNIETATPAETPSGYSSDAAAPEAAPQSPHKSMTMSEKKQSLENIKRAIKNSETGQDRAPTQLNSGAESGSEPGAETGAAAAKPMGVQHLKVFRRGDKVVLRGTVRSQEEKDRIGSVAKGAANGEQIVNELKVK